LSGPSGGGKLLGVLACTTMGSPESPWLFRHPLIPFPDAREPLDQGARPPPPLLKLLPASLYWGTRFEVWEWFSLRGELGEKET